MALKLITGPAVEPISLDEAKSHLRIDSTDEDALIAALIVAAREYCESFQRRAYVAQTWELILDEWPKGNAIWIPLPPLQSVESIKYKDKDGAESTLAATEYIVDIKSEPGRVVLAYGKSWPSVTLYPAGAITIQFIAGYGEASDIPQKVKQAMLLLLGHWYERREATGPVSREIEFAVNALLFQDRIFRW